MTEIKHQQHENDNQDANSRADAAVADDGAIAPDSNVYAEGDARVIPTHSPLNFVSDSTRVQVSEFRPRHMLRHNWGPIRLDTEIGFPKNRQLVESEVSASGSTHQLSEFVFAAEYSAPWKHARTDSVAHEPNVDKNTFTRLEFEAQRLQLRAFGKDKTHARRRFQLQATDNAYRQSARDQLLSAWNGQHGFRDAHGYIVDYHTDGTPTVRGEGTLHTAIAVVAIATGNYNQDSWERSDANARLLELLDTLLNRSWGNQDGFGRVHPIRHPDLHDYDAAGNQLRNSPLSKDSFGAIISACYYAYDCPHSSQAVREKAGQLVQKWSEYLVLHQWRLHSSTHPSYVQGEWEQDGDNYANIFSGPNQEPTTYKGPEAFILLPHEIYALKNVASHLGLLTVQIDPWATDLPVALKQTMVDIAAPYLADAAAQTLDGVLSLLQIRVPYSIDFGGSGNWSLGVMEGEFVVDLLPSNEQQAVVNEFRDFVADAIREYFRLLFLGQQQPLELIGLAVNRILNRMPDTLGRDSWRSVLTSAIQQWARWLTRNVWVEAASFIGGLQIAKAIDKPDITSYTAWSFAAECETSADMTLLLSPFILDFWAFLRGNDNPNGFWAWLAEDSGRVDQQRSMFEANDLDRWSEFAYGSTPFHEWASRPQNASKKSPRLDYLVLDGLAEMGPPDSIPDVIEDWWDRFVDAANQGALDLVSLIKAEFSSAGRYSRELIDNTGRKIVELWEAGGTYTRELFENGRRIEKLFSRMGGKIQKWLWNFGGEFTNYFKWQRLLPDGSVVIEDLVEWHLRGVTGELEKITWDSSHVFESYRKWWRSTAGGAAEAQDLIERKLRDADGVFRKWVWNNDHVFQSYRRWWRSTTAGGAEAADIALTQIRDAAGEMEEWAYTAAGEFERYGRWWRSTIDGTAVGGDMVEKLARSASGVLEKITWSTSHVFESYRKWWRSTAGGAAEAQDLVERKLRDAGGLLRKRVWNNDHVFQSYRRWWRSTTAGGAEAADIALTQIRDAAGEMKEWAYTAAGEFERYGRW